MDQVREAILFLIALIVSITVHEFGHALLALLVSIFLVVAARAGILSGGGINWTFNNLIKLNIFLMVFNLLPIPPLDGGALLAWVLPRSLQFVVDHLTRWGFLILLGLSM